MGLWISLDTGPGEQGFISPGLSDGLGYPPARFMTGESATGR